jgi:hypothetical protein
VLKIRRIIRSQTLSGVMRPKACQQGFWREQYPDNRANPFGVAASKRA